jgi:hypothetical protein
MWKYFISNIGKSLKNGIYRGILENTGYYVYTNLRQIPWHHYLPVYRTLSRMKGQAEYITTNQRAPLLSRHASVVWGLPFI